MKIHEYQAKALLSQYSIPVPGGWVARTGGETERIAGKKIKAMEAVGVVVAKSPPEILARVNQALSHSVG